MPDALRRLTRNRPAAPLLTALTVSAVGRWLYNVALPSYVFLQTHSPGWVAVVSVGRYLPALLATSVTNSLGMRLGGRRALLACDGAALAAATAMAAAMQAGAGPVPVVLIATACSIATRAKQPIAVATLITVVPESRLAAAAAAVRSTDAFAMAVGPAAGAALLVLTGSPALTVGLTAVSFLLSALATLALTTPDRVATAARGVRRGPGGAWRTLAGRRSPRTFALLGAQASVLLGVDTVLFVVLSQQQLHAGSAGYGLLFAGLGAGGLIGAASVDRISRTGRPLTVVLVALSVYALPTLAFLGLHQLAVGVGVEVLRGAAGAVAETVALIALQRTAGTGRLQQTVGLFSALVLAGVIAGAALAPLLLHSLGLPGALLVSGLAVPALALSVAPAAEAVNREVRERSALLAATVRELQPLSVFAGASRMTLERLAACAHPLHVPAGAAVVRHGEPADAFYVLRSGEADVTADADGNQAWLRRLVAPDHFGEIGLLRRVPRTATVTATGPLELLRIDGGEFLEAITGQTQLADTLDGVARGRLATGPSRPSVVTDGSG